MLYAVRLASPLPRLPAVRLAGQACCRGPSAPSKGGRGPRTRPPQVDPVAVAVDRLNDTLRSNLVRSEE